MDDSQINQVLDVLFESAESDARSRHLAQLEQAHVRPCMARQGFKFPILEAIPQIGVPTTIGYSQTVEVHQISLRGNVVSSARSHLPASEQARWNQALAGPPRPTVQVTAFGTTAETPTLGCLSAARTATYGDLRNWLLASVLSNVLHQEAGARLAAHAGIPTALAHWNACLEAAGVRAATDPIELAKRNEDRARTQAPRSQLEVKEANADLRCTPKLKVWHQAQVDVARDMWRRYAREISVVMAVRSVGGD